ncbi:hypothetical protein [Haloarcula montana]|uniref:hypothetical protein n=1 Tax=Haloarcula montana TaxID=3111776 RepID=UPI002D79DF4E|nr:hypothetical protein [Haloarcula sp. GH36]
MTGFRYGGARYGSARWSPRQPRQWTLDTLPLVPDSVELAPMTVTLSGQIPRSRLPAVRRLADRVGDYRERPQYGGATVVKPADDQPPVTVRPPSAWRPPAAVFEAVVDSLEIEEISPERRQVDIALRRTGTPLPDGELDESGGALDLSFSWGSLALPADAIGQIPEGGARGGETLSLSLDLRPLEARAIRAAARTEAIVTRSVSGNDDLVRDSADGEQTVTVTAVSETIVDGDYGVQGYSIDRPTHGRRPYAASLDLIKR